MSELKVRVTGDAASFNKTLQTAKTDAAKFNQQLLSQNKQLADSNKRIAVAGQFATRGMAVANAASMASGIPGMGPAGTAVATAANAFFGLKESASALGVSMLKASGLLAAFAFAITSLTKLYQEAYGLQKHLQDELESEVRESQVRAKTNDAYIKVLNDNKDKLKAGEYERLRRGVLTGDRGAMGEIRSRFGGTKLNKELQKELVRAQIEAMPAGEKRDLAMERMKFGEQAEALRERVGPSPSQATQAIASQIYSAMVREYQNRVDEIQKKQLEALKDIKENTKQSKSNPFR